MLARGAVADDPPAGTGAGATAEADVIAPTPRSNDNPAASATVLEISFDLSRVFVINFS
jgi:hypothetical protein